MEDIGEFGLIERIERKVKCGRGVVVGMGDDTAVLQLPDRSKVSLLTVDNLIEGAHFLPGTDARWVGRKALARSLSDIAAMGGVPKYATVALGIPPGRSVLYLDRFYGGFLKLAKEYRVDLVGGDVSHVRDAFFASVTLLGEVRSNQWVLRSGARVDDLLFVTGSLGGSLQRKHLRFKPRVAEGQWLSENRIPSAMLDISDGLVGDLEHLLKASRVGAHLYLSAIPVSRDAKRLEKRGGPTALERALGDGEDYELLFTSHGKHLSWMERFEKLFGVSVTCIGHIVRTPGVFFEDKTGKTKKIKTRGYTHFKKG